MAVADKDARNPTPDSSAPPTVIVDDVHVTYRVQGVNKTAGQIAPGSDAVSALRRIVRRGPAPGVKYIKAVRGVSFVAREGDAIGLIGRNGHLHAQVIACRTGHVDGLEVVFQLALARLLLLRDGSLLALGGE